MAKKRWYDKEASLEAGEIILEETQEDEVVAWTDEPVEETVNESMETSVSTVTELSQADIKWAKKNLSGTPHPFDSSSKELLERLCRYGIAADFGIDDGYARGCRWHQFCK